jgi:pyrimidine-nucleoside phosphorylase
MSFAEAIALKRDGRALDRVQIAEFVDGACNGALAPEQIGAMLMAVCCRGMSARETGWLTDAMLRSGERWSIASDHPRVVDKHSTGGVGDAVSLVFAPLMAAVGIPVAMMAGRGLGHSQGTLDKLAAIPGFDCDRDRAGLASLLDTCGAAIVAQTDRIAPADRVLYGMRDVTGTVPSLALITSSIMSKKLALGAAGLVLDVKCGRGAFCSTIGDAVELAAALRDVAIGVDLPVTALITDMNQPLAGSLGTASEVRAAIDVLGGGGGRRLRKVSLRLAREAMVLDGRSPSRADRELADAIDDGRALKAWNDIVIAHGGDPDPSRLPLPERSVEVRARVDGWVSGMAAETLGWVAVEAGAGRRSRDEELAFGAGLDVLVEIGDRVAREQPVAVVHVGDRPFDIESAVDRVCEAIEIGSEPVEPPELILGDVDDIQGSIRAAPGD